MAYLFAKDVVRQSIRLGLAGAWAHNFPDLEQAMNGLKTACPHLMDSLLPTAEHGNVEIEDEAGQSVQEDPTHHKVALSLKGFCLHSEATNYFQVQSTTDPLRLDARHPFAIHLREAFGRDYDIHNIARISTQHRIRWFQRLAFTNPFVTKTPCGRLLLTMIYRTTKKRSVYNVGDYVEVAGNVVCLAQYLSIRFRHHQHPYLFIIGYPVIEFVDDQDGHLIRDFVLDLPVYMMTREQCIFGLPVLTGDRLYLINAPEDGEWNFHSQDDDVKFLLRCNWRIDAV